MKINFNIDYRTNWGESVYIYGDPKALGGSDISKAVKLNLRGDDKWSADIELPDATPAFTYRYAVVHENGNVKHEWGHGHRFLPGPGVTSYRIFDRWQDMPRDKPFFSSAFSQCICRHEAAEPVLPATGKITIAVAAPLIAPGCVLAISGETEALGKWNPARAIRMNPAENPVWKVNIPANGVNKFTQFKFIILDARTGREIAWENGENRTIGIDPSLNTAQAVSGLHFMNPLKPWKGAGTAIPVFSLRSREDFGLGDFYDLKKMVDWAAATNQTFLQILPINDTTMTHTWTDSYPYNANSTFALHPMYLRLEAVGVLADADRRKYYQDLGRELNELKEIDYERATEGKIAYLREIFAQEGDKTLATAAYRDFATRNAGWLRPYAAFCTLRDRFGTPDFTQWGEYAHYTPELLEKVVKENAREIDFVSFIQFHLDKQMREAHEYANSKGIALKGDIPIGISRTSADAWVDPRLFNMDCQAGAPPDDFSILGQNWGFPTYNWEEMSKDGFAWWKSRFRKMSEYFDAYRIDHVLGFFRIWQIPMDALHGLLGYFNPALPYTVDEMRYSYDFWINPEVQTKPFIMDYFIEDFFGPYTAEVKERFLTRMADGRYSLRPEFDTQRKVADYFAAQTKDEKNTRMCEGLLGLIDNVLFIEDGAQPGKYHPRITAQYTYVYRSLNDYERWCFDRLYNDYFYHRHNDFWYGKAMWKLPPLIDSTDMLVCAEDLGMIPACVPDVMHRLEILSLEIQRMPKDPGSAFGNTWDYPYYSVCTTSTHDMGGIRAWWEENRAATQDFYNHVLHEGGTAPYFAEPWVCDRIIDLHLQSPSMLCILPLQDWLSIDGDLRRQNPQEEQINVPANSRHYWRYRLHLTLEELLGANNFNYRLRDKITHSDR